MRIRNMMSHIFFAGQRSVGEVAITQAATMVDGGVITDPEGGRTTLSFPHEHCRLLTTDEVVKTCATTEYEVQRPLSALATRQATACFEVIHDPRKPKA